MGQTLPPDATGWTVDDTVFWVGLPLGFVLNYWLQDFLLSFPSRTPHHLRELMLALVNGALGAVLAGTLAAIAAPPSKRAAWIKVTLLFVGVSVLFLYMTREMVGIDERQYALSLLDAAEDEVTRYRRLRPRLEVAGDVRTKPLLERLYEARTREVRQLREVLGED